jgi:hypothetical protein
LALLALLALMVLSLTVLKHRRGLLFLVAIPFLLAIVFAFYIGRDKTLSATIAQLEPGKVYFWKVVAEDDQGGFVESQTRLFVVKQ